jgi:heme exporter protein D
VLVVIAVAAMLTVRSVREALMRALRWRRREKRLEEST